MTQASGRPVRSPPRSIAIVGNAPEMADQAGAIDAADWVVRFNNAAGFGGRAGRRVTHLALVNHGGQMREWLADPGFLDRPVVQGARRFLFPFPRKDEPSQDEDGRDWTHEAAHRLASLGAEITVLPSDIGRAAHKILGTSRVPAPAPSTGFLITLHLLRQADTTIPVSIHGFGFAGWDGHDWAGERGWFEAMAQAGRLRLHPLKETIA